ncbi:MAG: haloacid dehalogenase-like hydrolase [Anaerococcus sp.]|nr:haloacid dehalogenase-like hydrolase [Anaerococcus sp.]
MKRLISSNTSDMLNYTPSQLRQSIKASEGRCICSENVATRESFIGDITSAEIAKAFGADLILLNAVDVLDPNIKGLDKQDDFARDLKKLVGRPIGVNLEPIDTNAKMMDETIQISRGRTVNEDSLKQLDKLGIDFLCLTGNPGTGVTNATIEEAIKEAKKYYNGLIIAGKMHSSGVDEPIYSKESIENFIEAGADIILLPAIGTVPGFNSQMLTEAVAFIHGKKALVMTAIGTSQEGSSRETIRKIAIDNKICGADIQHIGDAGFGGLAPVENIFEMSLAIRGIRHTVSMIARSINR